MSNSRAQELIELASQAVGTPDRPKKRPTGPMRIGIAALAVVIGGIGFVLARDDSDSSNNAAATATTIDDDALAPADGGLATGTTVPEAEPTVAPTSAAPEATTPATTVPETTAPETTVPETTAPADTVAVVPAEPAAPAVAEPAVETAADQPVRWAAYSGGKVYLEGTVPDQATSDELRDKAGAVVGIDNVIVNYAIVAGAPRPPSAPLYVRDSVLFAKNSVDINGAARGVLDLGVVLMSQNPQVTIDIEGHTDSDGSDAMNQTLSQLRVDVIFDYLVSQGVDPARLTKAAFGESQPIADNATSAGRAQNRRVEFQINNLLG